MDALKQLFCIIQVTVLLLISLHTSCAFPMADHLNTAKTISNKTGLAANLTKTEPYDSIDLSDALKSNVAQHELVRKYNDTGINVMSLLYNQQMKNRRQPRNAPSCTLRLRTATYNSPTTSCSTTYVFAVCQPNEKVQPCVTSTGQSGCRALKREIKVCGNERIQVPLICTCSLS